MVALASPVLAGAMALTTEASYLYMRKRGMQNAADAAAIAAATNAGSNYAAEARAVAAQFGFLDGSGNITVTAANPNTAAGCAANCYTVTVSDKVPLFFSQVIGYAGTTAVDGKGMTALSATSVAQSKTAYPFCILALANFPLLGPVAGVTGAVGANLNGCNVMSDSNAICVLTNLNANVGDAHELNLGCGITEHANAPLVPDPYAGLASNIPANPCGGVYYYEPVLLLGPPLPASNKLSGTLSANKIVCGDLQLTGNTTVTASNAVLVIENGKLDTNGFTLQTASGAGLTVVFTGTNILGVPAGSGTLDIAAPTLGPWSGIAIYHDPSLAITVNLPAAGVGPTWDISGMVYLPTTLVASLGAINKASNGVRCFGMVVGTVAIGLGGSIFPNNNQCAAAGLFLPQGGHRGTLVN